MREQIAPGRFSSPKKRPGPEATYVRTHVAHPAVRLLFSRSWFEVWLREATLPHVRNAELVCAPFRSHARGTARLLVLVVATVATGTAKQIAIAFITSPLATGRPLILYPDC